eukprot:gene154-4400_t
MSKDKEDEKNKKHTSKQSSKKNEGLSIEKNNSSKKEFRQSNFVLHFNAVFSEKEIGNDFRKFLKGEINEEPWVFLEELKKLKQIEDKEKFFVKSKYIVENFIIEKAKYEINIHGNTKKEILVNLDSILNEEYFDQKKVYQNLFHNVERIIKQELYHEPWKRFLRSKACELLIRKYQNDATICSPQLTEHFSYDDDYFRHPFIFDRDFEFSNSVFKDNYHWELISVDKRSGMNTFFAGLNYLPHISVSKDSKAIKYECILSGVSLQQLLITYSSFETVRETDPNYTFADSLAHYSYEDLKKLFKDNKWDNEIGKYEGRTLGVHVSHITLPKPFNPRIFHHSRSMIYDPETETIYSVIKPYIYKDFEYSKSRVEEIHPKKKHPKKKLKVYPIFSFVFTKYQKIEEQKVLFSQVMINDFGGWTTDSTIFKTVGKKRAKKFRSTLFEYVKRYPEDAKIEDYKDMLCKEVDGKFVDGYGKLLKKIKRNV